MNVALIVPAYKPTKDMLPMLERFFRETDFTAVVVDDGSGDEYAPLFEKVPEGTVLLRHEVNRGKGGAFLTGLEHAASEGYTHALQVDSDGQHDLADAPRSSSPPAGIPASSGRRVPNTTSPFRRSA